MLAEAFLAKREARGEARGRSEGREEGREKGHEESRQRLEQLLAELDGGVSEDAKAKLREGMKDLDRPK